jgi:excinuclease ABC subunit C
MEDAAALQAYETAAQLRDQIAYLRHIQTRQIVTKEKGNCDVFAVITAQGLTAAALLFIREGNVSGSRIFYLAEEMAEQFAPASAEILSAFIPQYYAEPALPVLSLEVITREKLADKEWLEKALKINIKQARHGEKLAWVKMAEKTGMEALKAKLAVNQQYARRLEELQQLLHLPVLPANMVCFDISHSSGEATMASCVVFDQKGPLKKAWRKYTIRNIQKNDDYAAMYQVLERFFSRQKNLPDIVFIDGGKGQLTQAEKVCAALNIPDIKMVAIAKGASRKPGFEQLFVSGDKVPLDTFPYPEALHLIQYIRDEAHRFAIQAHRKKRAKNRLTSVLDTIPGIGTKRRKELLRQLGGLQEIKRASIEQLQSVTGINTSLAEKIYQTLHESG